MKEYSGVPWVTLSNRNFFAMVDSTTWCIPSLKFARDLFSVGSVKLKSLKVKVKLKL